MDRVTQLVNSVPQVVIAARLGVDPSYLSLVLTGQREPSTRLLTGLRDELNFILAPNQHRITVDELADWLDMQMALTA